jgi:predicted tellurium resistance membrane protein TerC
MAVSIIIGGLLMIWLADRVAHFLQKNKMYEVLGLFILLVVGIMLLTDGGHLAQLQLFGHEITPMTKATFYFVIAVLVLTEIAQSGYQKKLVRLKQAGRTDPPPLPS